MATIELEKEYYCYDDCKQSGCPKHLGKLIFQSTSNSFHYDTGQGSNIYFEPGELNTLIVLIKELKEIRMDTGIKNL